MRSTKIIKICSSSLCTCLHHMVILRTRNKITDFWMILAWASPFNHHLFNMSIIDNPLCTCGRNETTNHFFIDTPRYHLHRVVLLENLAQKMINYNLDTLLHGTRDSLLDLQMISLLDIFITATK